MTIKSGAVINGNIYMPAGESNLIFESKASVHGCIEFSDTADSNCIVNIGSGQTAEILSYITRKTNDTIDFDYPDVNLTIVGGGTLSVVDGINNVTALNVSTNTTLNVNQSSSRPYCGI